MKFMSIEIPELSKTELGLRRLLFYSHLHTCQTYSDDGEMQDSSCMIDFLRDDVEEIETRISERNWLRYTESSKGDDSEEHF